MAGKLYLCATPIGNLEDITFRVIRTLKEVDLIAAEDTRNSIKLLNHFEISTPMTSYHEYNKIDKGHYLIGLMQQGQQIALITDAGTPALPASVPTGAVLHKESSFSSPLLTPPESPVSPSYPSAEKPRTQTVSSITRRS